MMTLLDQVITSLKQQALTIAVAESCTGGLLSAVMTEYPGSSLWFDRGFITYSNAAKQSMLGVAQGILIKDGAVSEAVVLAMAKGALLHSDADISIAISGIAGPDGGTPQKPVGTVWIAWAKKGGDCSARCYGFSGNRTAVRQQAVNAALEELLQLLGC